MAGDPHPKAPRARRARKRLGPSTTRAHTRDAVWWAGQVATRAYRARCAAHRVLAHDCTDLAGVDPQHLAPRSTRPDLAATVANIIPLCRAAHRWVDHHPDEAHALGLHRYSWEVPMPRPPSLVATLPHEDGQRPGSVEQPADTWEAVLVAYERLAPWLPPDVVWSYRHPPPPEVASPAPPPAHQETPA